MAHHVLLALLVWVPISILVAQEIDPNLLDEGEGCVFKECKCDDHLSNPNNYDDPDSGFQIDVSCMLDESNVNVFPHRLKSSQYKNIGELSLTSLAIVEIPNGRFANLSIAYANLQGNRISFLRTGVFENVSKLEILDLTDNQLIWIDSEALKPIATSLIELRLQGNQLSSLIRVSSLATALAPLEKLMRLNLAKNNLSAIPDMSHLRLLSDINLSRNSIKSIRDEMNNLIPSSVVNLNLEENRFDHITSQTFVGLSNLKYLNLGNNRISTIESDSFNNLPLLVKLTLTRNYLRHIPSGILAPLSYLESLDLSNQDDFLKTISDYAFDRTGSEKVPLKVDLSKNKIVKISERAFCSKSTHHPFAYIQELDLGSNQITHLNACVLRQLYQGFIGRDHYSNEKNKLPKIALTNSPIEDSRFVKCDCETTKSAVFVEFKGKCALNSKDHEDLSRYRCEALSGGVTLESVDKECASLTQFNCAEQVEQFEVKPMPKMDKTTPESFIPKTVEFRNDINDHLSELPPDFKLPERDPVGTDDDELLEFRRTANEESNKTLSGTQDSVLVSSKPKFATSCFNTNMFLFVFSVFFLCLS